MNKEYIMENKEQIKCLNLKNLVPKKEGSIHIVDENNHEILINQRVEKVNKIEKIDDNSIEVYFNSGTILEPKTERIAISMDQIATIELKD